MRLAWPCLFAVTACLLVVSLCLNMYLGLIVVAEGGLTDGRPPVGQFACLFTHSAGSTSKEVRSAISHLHHAPFGDTDHLLPHATGMVTRLEPWRVLSENIQLESGSSSGSSSGSGSASGSGSSSGGHHGPHQHDSLLFLFNSIFIGTAMLHVASVYHGIQLTVVLFVIGVVASLLLEGLKLKDHIGVFGESYSMWMDIDPHLLLFTLLPMLLAGDAMSIDTQVAKRVVMQCLYLAGPGVMCSALTVGAFLKFYLDWSFLLSMVTASILCATDPVAVVALLKELGASPMLTVQIQGESLLNDGTAIVLYTVCYEMLSGKDYGIADMAMFLVRTAMMAVALGLFLGYLFFAWLRLAGNRFNHHASVIQILLTFCAAYWSFCLAEGVLKMSGVLSTVGCSIVLAHHMWPHIVAPETLVHFWHTLENLGNIIIFLLGGALTGSAMLHIDLIDILHLLVIYVVLVLVRGGLIFASRPVLRMLSRDKLPVSAASAAVMTWGGLRGAVGLALAIQVRRGRAVDENGVEQISVQTADRVLFFVSGIGFLTTVVNATTCPALVTWLGITALPEKRHQLLRQFHQALVDRSISDKCPQAVTDSLRDLLHEIEHHVEEQRVDNSKQKDSSPKQSKQRKSLVAALAGPEDSEFRSIEEVKEDYQSWQTTFLSYSQEDQGHLQKLPDDGHRLGEVDKYFDILEKHEPTEEMCKAVVQLFLSLVYGHYWKQIQVEELAPGSPETDVLFTSVRFALSPARADLVDLNFILQFTQLDYCQEAKVHTHHARISQVAVDQRVASSCLGRFVMSSTFNVTCATAIILNTVFVCLEEIVRDDSNEGSAAWIVFEACFASIFLAEFLFKIALFRCAFWKEAWNIFDFVLVVLGIFGVIASLSANSSVGDAGASETRVIRVARVLRTMRFLRVFRILNARWDADTFVSEELAKHMHELHCLDAFVNSHLMAQALILRYMGSKATGEDDDLAIARCILQSQAAVYKALVVTLSVQDHMDKGLLDELKFTKERKRIVEGLQNFVSEAKEDGALTEREAAAILHPLHDNISQCLALLKARTEGVQDVVTPEKASVDEGCIFGARAAVESDGNTEQEGEAEKADDKTQMASPDDATTAQDNADDPTQSKQMSENKSARNSAPKKFAGKKKRKDWGNKSQKGGPPGAANK